MSETVLYVIAFVGGIVVGGIFFWGLWSTIKGLEHARHPALRMITSMVLRFALVLGGFYLLAQFADWRQLVVAALGFTLPRMWMVRLQARQIRKESLT